MNKHTPGPWIIDELAEAQEPGFYGAPVDPNGYHAVGADGWRVTGFMGDANAKLIAAAPELLEALRELLAAELAFYPSEAAGRAAQDRWADRRAAARNNASALIARVS